ncbi:hypothetical protein Tco_0593145, partial [Tanacetum coccineum]
MGLAGYYRRFIENFSKIAKPLTLLTQKNQKYEWGEKQEEAFQTLKDNLFNAPILSLPRMDYSMEKLARLYIDEIVARHGAPTAIISD